MSNNGGPADTSSNSSLPVTPSPVANPPESSTSSTSCEATPATSPQRESASNLPHANARSKKKAWRVWDLTRRVDTMDIDPRTPPATQSRVDGPAPATPVSAPVQPPPALPPLPPQSIILPLQPKESVVHPITASDGFLDDVSTNSDEAPNIRFDNHRTKKLNPSNVLGSAKRIIMNAKAEGANQAAIKRVLIKRVTRKDLLGWLTTMDPTLCPQPLNLYPNTPQWPLPPRTAWQMFQFIIAVYALPHYINRMRHCAMAGYWNVDESGQAVSAETFTQDCLTDARNFYTHLDAASLHQARPDSALINSMAINCFRNALTPEQWIQVEDRAQQHGFDFIEDIEQLIACARHMTLQKKLAPKPVGKTETPTPAPATTPTAASTPPTPAAHVHVIDADALPASPPKRAAPTDEGGRQNSKRFKGNSNPNNQKQEHRPQDCNRSPPCGNRSCSRDYDNRGQGGSYPRRSPSPRRLSCKRCGLDNHTTRDCKYSSYTAAWIKALTEDNGRCDRQDDCDYRGGRGTDNRRDNKNRRFFRNVSVTLQGLQPLGWWGTYGPHRDLARFFPLAAHFLRPAFVSCTAFKSNGNPSVALSPSPAVEADPCLSSGSSSTRGVELSTYPGMSGDVASLQPDPLSEQPRARLVVPSMSGRGTEPQGDREPLQVSDLDYLLVHYKKHPPKKRTQLGSAGEDGTEPPSK
ncbi:hypothetical protein M427DRAFT_32539 [Gonapodya prolifera JEL478]|uniref:Uncharacterized protein n=1 Tax=Gonapodya prolifera (strain JEL478) TaxID=1344416 RepID=A0A139AF13_GONPJ|nr:hypothetical protein M427DRAFT_32539 [Gonapodya prolifera JEL478]|eukprot:KXS15340.1 hypothetical protein M427DRAFT_32539 [Gonapodya prolifera JEL478]